MHIGFLDRFCSSRYDYTPYDDITVATPSKLATEGRAAPAVSPRVYMGEVTWSLVTPRMSLCRVLALYPLLILPRTAVNTFKWSYLVDQDVTKETSKKVVRYVPILLWGYLGWTYRRRWIFCRLHGMPISISVIIFKFNALLVNFKFNAHLGCQ